MKTEDAKVFFAKKNRRRRERRDHFISTSGEKRGRQRWHEERNYNRSQLNGAFGKKSKNQEEQEA